MKINFIFGWIGIFLLTTILGSCAGDDDTFYETSTTINYLTYDSVRDAYGTKITYTDYPMTVDLTGEADTAWIYNADSLPFRSNLSRTLLSISSSATIYRLTDDGYVLFQNRQDTLDCSNPVILKAIGSDENGNALEKMYKVFFNVHQIDADSVAWTTITPNVNFEGKQKSIILRDRLFVFTEYGRVYSSSLADGAEWVSMPTGFAFDYASATTFNGMIYLVSEGKVYASPDGGNWELQESLSADADVETLLGATSNYLAAVKNGSYCSTRGATWKVGGSASAFQRTWPASVSYTLSTNPSIEQVAVLGLPTGGTTAHNLLVAEDSLLNWSQWGPVDSASYQLPAKERMSLIRYRGDKFYSFGGAGLDAFTEYYTSNGLYWEQNVNHTFFPASFASRGEYSVIVDSEHYIWFIFSSSLKGRAVIYKGRFNSYSF